ncbi:MAG TPA: hypothetical protein VFH60_03115, partial [Chloroflexia bacterium]|nr:hypothetical protein [Chloroflexia bacterium]
LSGALLLLYKRAILAAGDAFDPRDYSLTGPKDDNPANTERLPRISVAHLAAIDRFNMLLPRLMEERRRIQAARVRSDREILPLLGRLWEPQFAGRVYADASRQLAAALDLYGLTAGALPNRVLVLASPSDAGAMLLATTLGTEFLVALASIEPGAAHGWSAEEGFTRHSLATTAPLVQALVQQADAVLAFPGAAAALTPGVSTPVAILGAGPAGEFPQAERFDVLDMEAVRRFCAQPGAKHHE